MKKNEIEIPKGNSEEINVSASLDECRILIEELKQSQVALELKNKELQKYNEFLKDQLQKHNDFSCIEYLGRLSLSRKGIIFDLDQTAFETLKRLVAEPKGINFIRFLDKKSLPGFHFFLTNVFNSPANGWCSATLNFSHNPTMSIQIEGILISDKAECIVKRRAAIANPPGNSIQQADNAINYKFLLEKVKEGVAVIHQNKSVVYINRPGELILGGNPGEFDGSDLEEIIISDQLEIIPDNQEFLDPKEKANVEIDILTRKGEKKILNVSCLPYSDNNGVKSGILLIFSVKDKEPKIAVKTIAAQIGGTFSPIKFEDALKQSHKNFQLVFNSINDFMFILDTEGKIITANPIVEQSLGYVQQELRGLSVLNVHPPERHSEVEHILDKMRKGQTSVSSIPLYRKNGDFIPVETKVEKGKWDGKDAVYYISRDITERQKAESKLMMQSLAFEAFTLAIIITDINGNIQWANSSFSSLSGYEMSEIIGKNPSQIVNSGKQGREFYQNMWNTILSGKVWSGELINRRKDGSLFPEELTITPVMDYMGKITNFIAIKIDITSRKEMETALKISEERWHFALVASGDGVWDLNLTNHDVFISDQCKTMLGYSPSEISGDLASWKKLVHPDDLEICRNDFFKHLSGEIGIYSSEYRMRCKDGSYIWVQDHGKVIDCSSDGKPLRITGTHKNITNSKLHEEQLKLGIEKEKELNELKSRFVATTSHEFRTPLASILMISETLISYHQKMNISQLKARLGKIKNHVLHLTDIVNNVLQLSKMQEGKIVFKPKKVELVAISRDIIDGFNSGKSFNNQITFNSPFKVLFINIDDRLIIQAINNLISNAIKYSDEEFSVDIGLRLWNNELIFTVRDKGIGIPEKDIKHLFTPFFRAGNTASIQGNGLGLSIVRESLILHGGRVSCSNNADKGSTFTLHFPVNLISTYNFNQGE